MGNAKQAYNQRISKIAELSHKMKQLGVESQFDINSGALLVGDSDRIAGLNAAIANDPIFESMDLPLAQEIVTGVQSSIREYEKTYGELPRDEVMASAYQTMSNMMILEGASKDGSAHEMMLESIGQSLSTSDGVEIRAKMVGLVLPVLLETATLDCVTMMPAGSNEVEIFKVHRKAGVSFGDYTKGQEIDQTSIGQYTSMRQRYEFVEGQRPDGTKTEFTFTSKTDLKNTSVDMPFNKYSVSLWVDRERVCRDMDSNGNGTMSGMINNEYAINCTIDYAKGIVVAKPTKTLPAGTELHVEFEVDIETTPELIPTIDHDMESHTLRPSQNAVAADATIQAMFTMQREFGQDLKSLQMSHMRNTLAAEKSTRHLRDINFICKKEETFNIYCPAGDDWKLQRELIHQALLDISQKILSATTTVGLSGMYAGTSASNILKTLGAPYFVPPANYTQKNSIHYVGKLFGVWKVFEAPVIVDAMDLLCYGRGVNHSEAGYVAGDAIAATMYNHPIGPTLRARNTLYELAYGEVHPFDGADYFYRLKLIDEVIPDAVEQAQDAA
ncbi:hypothetical protein [Vibrio marisflavi]|uniref:Capsid protein n=1 Tax=Vibrio marisflavi CECT 7928 TaxID=634439 RepID=A0ABN8EBN7_9VIBR|nr:hypothetical protein [Vibrio marisflavi]CAH0543038.1 hypothetical protein VMF7928_04371 [Vibrio marisflavi CECT 7928]